MTKFEIECSCGGHRVTKKCMTILQILVAKPKLWKKFIFLKVTHFQCKTYFFCWKVGKCSYPSLKIIKFSKKSLKQLDTLFARWWFFFIADVYVWKSKRGKNMQDYTHFFFGVRGFLLIDENMYLVSHCHVKNIFFYSQLWFFFSIQKAKNLCGSYFWYF